MNEPLKIVCWKWDKDIQDKLNKYTAEHVNVFASMVSRNLSLPHEIICITDNLNGIDKGIKTIPIWDDLKKYGMCFRRLKAFSPEMKDIIGSRFISMDLDCVILNDITSLVDHDNDFMIWKSETKNAPYCGSMWMMDTGAREHIWTEFKEKDLIKIQKNYGEQYINKHAYNAGFVVGSDQSWLNYNLYDKEKSWTKEDGVLNFRTHVYRKFRTMPDLTKTKIIFFNGKYDPADTNLYKEHPWIQENWK